MLAQAVGHIQMAEKKSGAAMNSSAMGLEGGRSIGLRREVPTNAYSTNNASVAEKPSRRLTRSERRRRRLRNQYNREYMRRWRTTPKKKRNKKRCLRRKHTRSAQRGLRTKSRSRAQNSRAPICGMCKRVRATCVVTRFEITEETESGFRPVRVPYCGFC